MKAKIDNTQLNSKCKLNEERDKTVNHIMNKCKIKHVKARLSWEGDPQGIVQEIKTLTSNQMEYTQNRIP